MRVPSPIPARLLVALCGSLAAGAAGPSAAAAQMTARFLEYGTARGAPGTDANTYFVNWPLSEAECTANVGIPIRLDMVPIGTPTRTLDLWDVGAGSGTPAACQDSATRASTTSPICKHMDWSGIGATITPLEIAIPPQDFFPDGCTGSADRNFYIMALSSQGDTSETLTATHYARVRVVLDAVAPGAPTASSAAGDASITVGWTNPTGTETLAEARIYVDLAGCGGGDGGTSTLMPGGTPPGTYFARVMGGSPTSASLSSTALGLDYGESAAVAVTLVDLARNESRLSNVVCVTRVDVSGFWDAYCAGSGLTLEECRARYSSCSCAVPGRRGPGSAAPALVLGCALAGLALARTRARRRS